LRHIFPTIREYFEMFFLIGYNFASDFGILTNPQWKPKKPRLYVFHLDSIEINPLIDIEFSMITLGTSSLKKIRLALRELSDHIKVSFHLDVLVYLALHFTCHQHFLGKWHYVSRCWSPRTLFFLYSFSAPSFHRNIAVNGDEWTSYDDQWYI